MAVPAWHGLCTGIIKLLIVSWSYPIRVTQFCRNYMDLYKSIPMVGSLLHSKITNGSVDIYIVFCFFFLSFICNGLYVQGGYIIYMTSLVCVRFQLDHFTVQKQIAFLVKYYFLLYNPHYVTDTKNECLYVFVLMSTDSVWIKWTNKYLCENDIIRKLLLCEDHYVLRNRREGVICQLLVGLSVVNTRSSHHSSLQKTKQRPNAGYMTGQRRRRFPVMEPTLGKRHRYWKISGGNVILSPRRNTTAGAIQEQCHSRPPGTVPVLGRCIRLVPVDDDPDMTFGCRWDLAVWIYVATRITS